MCARPRKSRDAISAGCFLCYFLLRQKKVVYQIKNKKNFFSLKIKNFRNEFFQTLAYQVHVDAAFFQDSPTLK